MLRFPALRSLRSKIPGKRTVARPPLPRSWKARARLVLDKASQFPATWISAAGLLTLGFVFHHFLMNSTYFMLEEVSIEGNVRLSERELTDALLMRSGVEAGVSLLQISPDQIKRNLMSIPEIDTVTITKEWPRNLSILIEERKPVGLIVSQQGSFVFDKDYLVFSLANAGDFLSSELPVLSGFKSIDIEPGKQLPSASVALIDQYDRIYKKANPELAERISEYHFDEETGISLVFRDGERVICGYMPPNESGPIVQVLMEDSTLPRIEIANVVSREHVMIRRRTAPSPTKTSIVARSN